jgi:hypothetical protein
LKLQDALNLVCFRDDKQAVDSRVVKIYSDSPGLTIYIDTALPDVSQWLDKPSSREGIAPLMGNLLEGSGFMA